MHIHVHVTYAHVIKSDIIRLKTKSIYGVLWFPRVLDIYRISMLH